MAPGAEVLAGAVDVVAESEDELAAIEATARQAPLATLVFAQLLRASLGRTIAEGLVAESLARQPRPFLRVWVAGCSSGEEPLSIAAILRETLYSAPGTSLSVLGTEHEWNAFRFWNADVCD